MKINRNPIQTICTNKDDTHFRKFALDDFEDVKGWAGGCAGGCSSNIVGSGVEGKVKVTGSTADSSGAESTGQAPAVFEIVDTTVITAAVVQYGLEIKHCKSSSMNGEFECSTYPWGRQDTALSEDTDVFSCLSEDYSITIDGTGESSTSQIVVAQINVGVDELNGTKRV